MNEEREEIDRQIAVAKQTALDIEDGIRTRYWSHLKRKIEGWVAVEEKRLKLWESRLVTTQEDANEENDIKKRLVLLRQFSGINEEIIDENLSVFGNIVPHETFLRNSNFVSHKDTENKQ